jgi:hypothetical protein
MKHAVLVLSLLLAVYGEIIHAQEAPKPATVQQIKDAIDWAKLPKLDGADKVQTAFHHITYEAPGTFQQAADFHAKHLPALGWKIDKSLTSSDQKEYLSQVFEKSGMLLQVSGYRGKPDDPMTISLMNYGNVDVSLFPKVADAQIKQNNQFSVHYFSKQKPEEITGFCRKFMKERGWTEKVDDTAADGAKEGRYMLTFHQNAMECIIVVSKTKEGATEITSNSMVRHDLSTEGH